MLAKFSSSFWVMSEYGWYPLLLIVSTPWFLHQLGTEQYGYWMLLTATVGFGGVLNTGTGAATIKAVSAEVGRSGGVASTEQVVRASIAIAVLGGGVLGLLVFAIFWYFGVTLLGEMDSIELVRRTGIAAAFLIWLEQLDNVFSSALKGAEHFGSAARVEIVSKTFQVLACVAVLWAWSNLEVLYVTLLVVAILRLFAKYMVLRKIFGHTDLRPSLRGIQDILNFAKWGWLQGIGSILFGIADRLLVGSLLGAASLSYYSIATQLAMQIHAAAAAGLSVIFPKISRKLESIEAFSLWRVMKFTMAANLIFSSALAALLLAFGPEILVIWIGVDAAEPTSAVLPWLVIAYWLLALNVVPYYVLLGLGKVRFVGMTVLSAGIVSVIGMYFSITHLGLVGAPLGRDIYAVLTLVLVFPLVRYFDWGRSNRSVELGDNNEPKKKQARP